MYPHERSLVERLKSAPFALIGVNTDKDLKGLQKTLVEENITWRSFWNGPKGTGGRISTKWNITNYPTTYILDANGKIRFKDVRGEAMDEAVDQLLAEMEALSSKNRILELNEAERQDETVPVKKEATQVPTYLFAAGLVIFAPVLIAGIVVLSRRQKTG